MKNSALRVGAVTLAAIVGLLCTVPANAQLVAPNWPTPTSSYEQSAMTLLRKIFDHYQAGYLTDMEFAEYNQEVYCAMDACMWRRMRKVSDTINNRRTMKRLHLIEDQYNYATSGRRSK